MSAVIREAKYIKSSVAHNNNKFWYITEFDDATCEVQFGRVGGDGARKRHSFGAQQQATHFFESKCREKESDRKGYRRLQVLDGVHAPAVVVKQNLARVAAEQIDADCPQTRDLIRYLSDVNIHNILATTTMKYDVAEGSFRTPCGIVTADNIADARSLLTKIGRHVAKQDFRNSAYLRLLDDYLMLIPQKVGRKLDPETLFPDREAVRAQSDLLDALEASVQSVLAQPSDAPEPSRVFDVRVQRVSDRKEVQRIRAKYRNTLHDYHACAHLDVKTVYAVDIGPMRQAWTEGGERVGNVQELWHGTRAANVLSILKGGLLIPPSNAPYCTGRMFGNGIYFSDQSTKSLNYAFGYWAGQRDDNCFMFLADVAMGKSYSPRGPSEDLPKPGYDSTFARAGASGVVNNEMIVYRTCQVNLRFLVECAPGR